MTDILPVPPPQRPPTRRMEIRRQDLEQQAARQTRRRWLLTRIAAPIGAAALIGSAGGLVYAQSHDRPETHSIESSYAFDVTNPIYVAGYADNVFIGTVRRINRTDAEQGLTYYDVSVKKLYAGRIAGTVVVSQLGYRDGSDRYVPEGQHLLSDGRTYLLATTNARGGGQTVIAGPEAVTEVKADNRVNLDRKWSNAVENKQDPPGVPPVR